MHVSCLFQIAEGERTRAKSNIYLRGRYLQKCMLDACAETFYEKQTSCTEVGTLLARVASRVRRRIVGSSGALVVITGGGPGSSSGVRGFT